MARKAVVDAVKERLADAALGVAIYGPNERYRPPTDGAVFIRHDYPVTNSEQLTIGAPGHNVWRDEGVFRLIVHAERGAGVDAGLALADQLADLFRGKEFGGVQTFAPSPAATDDDSENGNYFILAIAVPYQFDLIG